MDVLKLSEDQEKAHSEILSFYAMATAAGKDSKEKKYITLGGYAGTGKTTLIVKIVESLREMNPDIKIAFCALTGKAANVMSTKLGSIGSQDYCGTIHALIYQPILRNKVITGWTKIPALGFDLLVVDEASMVDGEIFSDLRSFDIPILAVGDHGQLPPVNGDFNLMSRPDVRLEKIHRQAEDNPIIKLSFMARKDGYIPEGEFGAGVRKVSTRELPRIVSDFYMHSTGPDPLFLCGFNSTRVFLNKLIRQSKKIKSADPVAGERVICLRNNRAAGIYNGMSGTIEKISNTKKEVYDMTVRMDGDNFIYQGQVSKFQFGLAQTPERWNLKTGGDLFDFGYCLTVHKAQGSESETVALIEQRFPDMDDYNYAKWLYTGITRARKGLLIIAQK